MKNQRKDTSQLSMPRTKSIRTILVKHTGANTAPQNLWVYSFVQPQNYRGTESILPGFELVVPGRLGAKPPVQLSRGAEKVWSRQSKQEGPFLVFNLHPLVCFCCTISLLWFRLHFTSWAIFSSGC